MSWMWYMCEHSARKSAIIMAKQWIIELWLYVVARIYVRISLKSSASWWSSLRFRCMLNRKSTKKKVWARKGGLTNSSYSCVCEIIRMNLQGELRRVRILQNVWVLPYNDCLSSLEKTFQLRRNINLRKSNI